jgi:hypothetical protein
MRDSSRMPTKKKTTKKKTTTAAPKVKAAPAKSYKESPLKGMPIDEWLRTQVSGWQRDLIEKLVALTRKAAPKATISIKWRQPTLEANGPFAFIKPAKAHVTFGFFRGAELKDPAGLLVQEGGARMKIIRYTEDGPIPTRALSALIKDAVAQNLAKGSAMFDR